jgi:hypothetical protein
MIAHAVLLERRVVGMCPGRKTVLSAS